jgi:hypothetical protein
MDELSAEERRQVAWDKAQQQAMPLRPHLESGGPWDTLPDQLDNLTRAARRYVARADFPEDARQRVREVWLEGKYRPAWLPRRGGVTEYRDRLAAALPQLGLEPTNPLEAVE